MVSNRLREPQVRILLLLLITAAMASFLVHHYPAATMRVLGFPTKLDDLFQILIGLTYPSFAFVKNLKGSRVLIIRWLFPCLGILNLFQVGASIIERG
jgi:hypothetical protein